jgi:hypothetical protein
MPLVPDAERLIRGCFAVIKRGKKPRRVTVGYLTKEQLADINMERERRGFVLLSGEIFFIGTHLYGRRIIEDGYTEDDVLKMIQSAMSEKCCFVRTQKMTVLQSPNHRDNGYGCKVRDELTLECSASPLAELYSVVPRGDRNYKPNKLREATNEVASEELTNSPR